MARPRGIRLGPRPVRREADEGTLPFGEKIEHVAALVEAAALDQRTLTGREGPAEDREHVEPGEVRRELLRISRPDRLWT